MDPAPLALFLLIPNPMHLGADDFREREAWQAFYSNPLSGRLLPDRHPDPEVQHRIRAIKAGTLRGADPVYQEGVLRRDDYREWVRRYVLEADSVAYTLDDVFVDLHTCGRRADVYFALHPAAPRGEGFLRGVFLPGEYDHWRAHVAAYREPWACVARSLTARRGDCR